MVLALRLGRRDTVFGLGALVISERNWNKIDCDMEKLKAVHFGASSTLEIHTREIFKREKQFSHFIKTQSEAILGDVYSLISSANLTLLTVLIDKTKLFAQDPNQDAEYLAWKYLLERMDMCVQRQCSANDTDEYGLVIMDESERSKDDLIRKYMRYLRTRGTGMQYINRIIEDIVFTPSHWHNLTQIADAVVYCSKNYLRKEPFFTKQFLAISNKFDTGKTGKIEGNGFKVYPS